jgi:hypothetical protein
MKKLHIFFINKIPPDPGLDHPSFHDCLDHSPILKPSRKPRDDKTLSTLENSIFDFTTVVMKLNRIFKKGKGKVLRPHILNVVSIINRISSLTYYFINLHVHRIISQHQPVPSQYDPQWYEAVIKDLPQFDKQNWYNMVSNSIVPINGVIKEQDDPAISETYQLFKTLYPNNYHIPNRDSLGQIQSFLNKNILKSVIQHLEDNMPKRINTYLKVEYEITDPGLRKHITDNILNGPSEFESRFDTDQTAQTLIAKYAHIFTIEQNELKKIKETQKARKQKEKLEMERIKKETGKDNLEILQNKIDDLIDNKEGKKHTKKVLTAEEIEQKKILDKIYSDKLSRYLIFQYQMLLAVEKKGGKRWSLLPSKGSFIDGHITLSTECMIDLLKSNCLEDKSKPRSYFKDMGENIWNEIFKIPSNRGSYFFNHQITTNGYSVSLNYKILPKDFVSLTKISNYKELSFEEKYDVLKRYKKIKEAQEKKRLEKEKENKKEEQKKMEEQIDRELNNDKNVNKEINGEKKQWILDITKSIEEDYTRILGLDPGNRSLFTCIDKTITEKKPYGEILKCGSKEFKHLTGDRERTKERNKRKDSIPVLKEMTKISLKTGDYEKYKDNLMRLLEIEGKVLEEYKRLWYRKINFTGYQKKQKAFGKLAKRLQGDNEEEKVLIGWGNGGDGSRLKGAKVPGKGFKNYIKKNTKMKVIEVDENLTTQMCSKCCRKTRMMYKIKEMKKGEGEINNEDENGKVFRKVSIYGLKHCKECHMIWDRDVNASENILKVLLCYLREEARPTYLCRKRKNKNRPGIEKSPQDLMSVKDVLH